MAILETGFPTTITITTPATIKMEEKVMTPPSIKGGGGNSTTSHRNTKWHTTKPKKLLRLEPINLVVSYDAAILDQLIAGMQVNQLLELKHPDLSLWKFWGWIDEFNPSANNSETDEQPTAGMVIIPSNENNSGVEVAPIYDDGVP